MFQVPIVHPNVPSSRCMCLCSSPPSLWAISNPNKWPAPPLDFDFTDEKQISILIWLNWQMRRMQISISYRFGWIAGECASPCVPAQLALNSSVLLRRDPFSFHRNRGKRPPSLPQSPFNVPLTSKIGTFYNLGSRAASFFLPLTMFCRRWLTYSMWLAHNANIRLKISGIFVFPSCLLFIACQVQFEIYHSAMFIFHKHQINAAIHKNYLALQQNCWLMSLCCWVSFAFKLGWGQKKILRLIGAAPSVRLHQSWILKTCTHPLDIQSKYENKSLQKICALSI